MTAVSPYVLEIVSIWTWEYIGPIWLRRTPSFRTQGNAITGSNQKELIALLFVPVEMKE